MLSVGGLTQTRKMFATKKEIIDQIVETIEKSNVYTQCLWSKYIENQAKVANLEQEEALEEILKKLNIDNSIKDEFLNFILLLINIIKVCRVKVKIFWQWTVVFFVGVKYLRKMKI